MALADVQTIINNAIATANTQTAKVDAWADKSFISTTIGAPPGQTTPFTALDADQVQTLGFPATISIPQWQVTGRPKGGDPLNDDIISIIKDLNQFSVQYGIDAIGPKLQALFATYFSTYFPSLVDETLGVADLKATLASKGFTLPVSAEDAIFQRGRARIVADGNRAEQETIAEWSSRGFQMPPGALIMQQQMIRQNTQDKVASAASDIVVKQAELAVDTFKFAIQAALQYRESALNNAVQYLGIFTNAVLKGFNAEAYAAILDARNRMYGTSLELYKSMSAARELKLRLSQQDHSLTLDGWKTGVGVVSELTRSLSNAAIGAANAVGHVAAAAMSGVNAAASISDNTSN